MLKIGDKVKMVNCIQADMHPEKVWVVNSEPWHVCGSTVVLLEGRADGFDVDCLQKVG